MKRDWDIVREILIKLEELGDANSFLRDEDVNGYDRALVAFHMHLLDEAGLIKAGCGRVPGGWSCQANCMTWRGYEFLDHIRQDRIWNRVKSTAREKGLSLSLDLIAKLAVKVIDSIL